jgi:type III restriction enzyme
MGLHPDFPLSPYEELAPDVRWFPAAEELRTTAYRKLLPPLVAQIRESVALWRDAEYAGASPTSRGLLNWWFKTDHLTEQADGPDPRWLISPWALAAACDYPSSVMA